METSLLTDRRTVGSPSPDAASLAEAPPMPAPVFVWGVWALMSVMAMGYVWRYGSIVPFWEEWLYVPCVLGAEPFSLSWLWEQYLEHRYPLHKLVVYLSFSTFGLDERPILLLDVGLFAILAAALIWAVRKVRGRSCYSDAFFPLVLLNFGHAETLYWAATNTYVMTSFLAGMILVILFATGSRLTTRTAVAVGVCLVVLPLCHGFGLLYAACLSCGLGVLGIGLVRSAEPTDRRAGRVLLAFVGLALVIVALNFVGYQGSRLVKAGGERGLVAVLKSMFGFLIQAFGFAGHYPYDRWMKRGMVALLAIAVGCLAAGLLRGRDGRWRTLLGPGLVFGTSLVVALAIGYGRAPWGADATTANRYTSPAVPTLVCLYVVWEVCGPRRVRAFGRAALCLLAFAFLATNLAHGREDGARHRREQEAFLADVRAGVPIPQLAARHRWATYYIFDHLEACLRLLRDRRYGDYARLPADPSFREIPLPAPASAATGLVWDGKRGRSTSDAPELTFDLPRPMRIAGIRMRYSNVNPGGWTPLFEADWRLTSDVGKADPWRKFEHWFLKPDGREVTLHIWIDDMVDRIQIHPDKRPCDFTLSDIVLLVPQSPTGQNADDGPGTSKPADRGLAGSRAAGAAMR